MRLFFSILSTILCMSLFGQSERLTAADLQIRQGNLELASTILDGHLEHQPNDHLAYLMKSEIYRTKGISSKSNFYLEQALSYNPMSLLYIEPIFRSKALAKLNFGYNKTGETFYKSPIQSSSYRSLIEKQYEENQFEEYDWIIQSMKTNPTLSLNSAFETIEKGHRLEWLESDLYGIQALKLGDFDQAIEWFTTAIHQNSAFPISYHNRSVCYLYTDDFEKARNDIYKAIELNNEISQFHFTKAKLYKELSKKHYALDSYSKALELNNDYAKAKINYANLLKDLGEYKEGIALSNEYAMDNEKEGVFVLAGIHFIYGEYNEAINLYNDYISISDDCSSAYYNRGLAKILNGQTYEGCLDLEESLTEFDTTSKNEAYDAFCSNNSFTWD